MPSVGGEATYLRNNVNNGVNSRSAHFLLTSKSLGSNMMLLRGLSKEEREKINKYFFSFQNFYGF